LPLEPPIHVAQSTVPVLEETIDVAGAVGPKHVVDFDEGGFVVHGMGSLQVFGSGDEARLQPDISNSDSPR